jgi:hypothetical protein
MCSTYTFHLTTLNVPLFKEANYIIYPLEIISFRYKCYQIILTAILPTQYGVNVLHQSKAILRFQCQVQEYSGVCSYKNQFQTTK